MSCRCKWNQRYCTETKHKFRRLMLLSICLGVTVISSFAQVPDKATLPTVTEQTSTNSMLSVTDSTYRQVIRNGSQTMNCYLTYPQGRTAILENFGNNAAELSRLDRFLNQVFRDSLIYVDSIHLCGYCSIEGSWSLNDRLARNRALGFQKYLNDKYALSSRYPIGVTWVAEDWDKLSEMVAASSMEDRDTILALIRNIDINKGRELALMNLDNGEPYHYMAKEFFTALRRVEIVINYDLRRIIEKKMQRKLSDKEYQIALTKEREAVDAEEERLAAERARQEAEQKAAAEQAKRAAEQATFEREKAQHAAEAQRAAEAARREAERVAAEQARLEAERAANAAARQKKQEARKLHPIIGLKTDLVAWSGLCSDFKYRTFMPNLEVEVYFANRWSVAASALYANWPYSNDQHFWGISSYSGEGRFWIRNNGLFRGFFVGVYGMAGDFNLQQNRSKEAVSTNNKTGNYWSAGISAGYLLPLSKHWNLELSLRGGYRSADYDFYDRELPHFYYSGSDKQSGFALTGLRLNVVYRFGRNK